MCQLGTKLHVLKGEDGIKADETICKNSRTLLGIFYVFAFLNLSCTYCLFISSKTMGIRVGNAHKQTIFTIYLTKQ